ncbi:MAG: hypothetical protein H7Y10_03585 [Flavobacterium sp.]|nr:hypothetical protein [Flavobacterium sp.]
MKNLLAITVFAVIVFIANLFKSEPKITLEIQSTIRSGKITLLTNQRKLLVNEINYKLAKNSIAIDSLKNN